MKKFRDLQYGSIVWKLYINSNGVIRLDKLITIGTTPMGEGEDSKFVILLSNGNGISMTDEDSQGCQLDFDDVIYYCDKNALIQRIEKEEDLAISQLISNKYYLRYRYNSTERMFSEVYETI